MILRLLVLLAALLAAPAQAQQEMGKIDRLVGDFMRRERVPGVTMVVLRGDQPVFERSWGSGRMGAVQPFYSISKQMTAALVLKLVEQGRLDLGAPVGRYLPKWSPTNRR